MITAEEESSKVVTTIPTRMLLSVLDVNLTIYLFAFSPTMRRMVSERLLTANRKSTKPASIERMISVITTLVLQTYHGINKQTSMDY